MPQKGYINESIGAGRIVSHGKISDLSNGFKLPNGKLFSVYIRPKSSVSKIDTVLSVKCYQDNGFSEAPIAYNDWSPLLISEIAPDNSILETNEIYWGSGQFVEE